MYYFMVKLRCSRYLLPPGQCLPGYLYICLHFHMVYSGPLHSGSICFWVTVGYTIQVPKIYILMDKTLFSCLRKFSNKKSHFIPNALQA